MRILAIFIGPLAGSLFIITLLQTFLLIFDGNEVVDMYFSIILYSVFVVIQILFLEPILYIMNIKKAVNYEIYFQINFLIFASLTSLLFIFSFLFLGVPFLNCFTFFTLLFILSSIYIFGNSLTYNLLYFKNQKQNEKQTKNPN